MGRQDVINGGAFRRLWVAKGRGLLCLGLGALGSFIPWCADVRLDCLVAERPRLCRHARRAAAIAFHQEPALATDPRIVLGQPGNGGHLFCRHVHPVDMGVHRFLSLLGHGALVAEWARGAWVWLHIPTRHEGPPSCFPSGGFRTIGDLRVPSSLSLCPAFPTEVVNSQGRAQVGRCRAFAGVESEQAEAIPLPVPRATFPACPRRRESCVPKFIPYFHEFPSQHVDQNPRALGTLLLFPLLRVWELRFWDVRHMSHTAGVLSFRFQRWGRYSRWVCAVGLWRWQVVY